MKTCASCIDHDWTGVIPRCRKYSWKSLSLDVDYRLTPLKECLRDQEQEALIEAHKRKALPV